MSDNVISNGDNSLIHSLMDDEVRARPEHGTLAVSIKTLSNRTEHCRREIAELKTSIPQATAELVARHIGNGGNGKKTPRGTLEIMRGLISLENFDARDVMRILGAIGIAYVLWQIMGIKQEVRNQSEPISKHIVGRIQ